MLDAGDPATGGEAVDAVVVGLARDIDYGRLDRTAAAVRAGARLLASNDDRTFPGAEGIHPGCGAILAAVEAASGAVATVAGKPYPPMADLIRSRFPGHGVVVGDKGGTDGRLALELGWDFGLVLSGVTTEADLPLDVDCAAVAPDLARLVDRWPVRLQRCADAWTRNWSVGAWPPAGPRPGSWWSPAASGCPELRRSSPPGWSMPVNRCVVQGERPRFVGRGGEKLDGALERFGLDPSGLRVLDAGASTGGFTDCLLQRGAAHVVALDVGHGQLHERLRADDRVAVAGAHQPAPRGPRACSVRSGPPLPTCPSSRCTTVLDVLVRCCRPGRLAGRAREAAVRGGAGRGQHGAGASSPTRRCGGRPSGRVMDAASEAERP